LIAQQSQQPQSQAAQTPSSCQDFLFVRAGNKLQFVMSFTWLKQSTTNNAFSAGHMLASKQLQDLRVQFTELQNRTSTLFASTSAMELSFDGDPRTPPPQRYCTALLPIGIQQETSYMLNCYHLFYATYASHT
jgi:hypothetical protein